MHEFQRAGLARPEMSRTKHDGHVSLAEPSIDAIATRDDIPDSRRGCIRCHDRGSLHEYAGLGQTIKRLIWFAREVNEPCWGQGLRRVPGLGAPGGHHGRALRRDICGRSGQRLFTSIHGPEFGEKIVPGPSDEMRLCGRIFITIEKEDVTSIRSFER